VSSHPFRDLTQFEVELLSRLLDVAEENEPGRYAVQELRAQAATCRVRTITEYGDNYGSFELELPFSPPFDHLEPIVDTIADDEDGVPIEAILFLANGRLYELEIVRADGLPLKKMPAATQFADYEHYAARHGLGQTKG